MLGHYPRRYFKVNAVCGLCALARGTIGAKKTLCQISKSGI
jgi:hypothetical protein